MKSLSVTPLWIVVLGGFLASSALALVTILLCRDASRWNVEPAPAVQVRVQDDMRDSLVSRSVRESGMLQSHPMYRGSMLIKKDPDRQAILELLMDDDFLGDDDRPWEFDDDTITVGE